VKWALQYRLLGLREKSKALLVTGPEGP
jgi:hypothetical protein